MIVNSLHSSFPAHGCADLYDDEDVTIRRTAESAAVVKCKQTQYSWNIVCQENKWVGDFRNCTEQTTQSKYVTVLGSGTVSYRKTSNFRNCTQQTKVSTQSKAATGSVTTVPEIGGNRFEYIRNAGCKHWPWRGPCRMFFSAGM